MTIISVSLLILLLLLTRINYIEPDEPKDDHYFCNIIIFIHWLKGHSSQNTSSFLMNQIPNRTSLPAFFELERPLVLAMNKMAKISQIFKRL